jgi:hypothetical protein
MEDVMTDWYPQHNLSKEEAAVQARWMRRLAVVYGAVLLLLVAFVAANRMLGASGPGVASNQAPHVAHAPVGSARQTH